MVDWASDDGRAGTAGAAICSAAAAAGATAVVIEDATDAVRSSQAYRGVSENDD